MNLVSVILPVYNAASTLARTIESVVNQTYENIELIIIDDGSTDKSLEIANHYSRIENIRIITQINSGASVARNNGINIARGK
jgi:glycosyltransferase involved in cell wall biosynthesis